MTSTLLLAAMAGCSDGESRSVPKLPERLCWGVFADDEITPLMRTGTKAKVWDEPFALAEGLDSVTCILYIDGVERMLVDATRYDFEGEVDWSPWDKARPQPIDVGERGIIWPNGAGTHIVCEASKSPSEPGKYIEMHLSVDGSPDEKKLRAALPGLLQQFVTFAKRELNCP
ncbi:hypothetical protein [Streptomyces sp. NPDC050848]|uniref:hypothetical protein n=1 Tax=Streptomyces sp. NPDC050848 TaxID=3155791 RepID=UPI0033F0F6D4